MKKKCVFCGLEPETKNKEHIIPQWLIKLTGDPHRKINLGIDVRHYRKTGEPKIRTYSFSHFQFPACTSCNTEFSALESRVQTYFIKIFNHQFFSNTEIDDLLDWFDKVRTGLWLGNITLDETIEDVMPKFYIKDRIGAKDRCLFIYELENDEQKGIQFIGANSPGFHFTPSCFSLRVNNIYFFNYSFDFLFSKNIGFPYSKTLASSNREDRGYLAKLEKGTEVISKPLINFKFLKASTYIYQPIIPKLLIEDADETEDVYETEYVKNNCLDYEKRKGDIFYFNRDLFKLIANEELQLTTGLQNLDPEIFPRLIAKQTLKTLELVNQIKPELELLTSEQKEIVLKNRSYILKMHRDFMSGLQ